MGGEKALVALSGGVDSSVAALLLKDAGYEVEGITMQVLPGKGTQIEEAAAVAADLGIIHHVIHLEEDFERAVLERFHDEYLRGRTPNPCVSCNRFIKFGRLREEAVRCGARLFATGHYVRLVTREGAIRLAKGVDAAKDQSYFLALLERGQLQGVAFPLGKMTKEEVRHLAQKRGLPAASHPESQDICFIGEEGYAAFLESRWPMDANGGEICHVNGQVLGRHAGSHRFTIGQRRGLGIAWPEPLYVVGLQGNQVLVGERPHLAVSHLTVEDPVWHVPVSEAPFSCLCRIRYRHREARAVVSPLGERHVEVAFDEPQYGVAPGQAAVFYQEDLVLGGGWIA
ncbi:MAG: tRNA 2-thiouridine(34) synthase MnmA [Deltaproteobacteria bacterium]|nr:tRNA 2-thiouridine(34) synthase MnmA [Deltaproteobacteria bacterium]